MDEKEREIKRFFKRNCFGKVFFDFSSENATAYEPA
jgi:hypothetical protein